MSKQSVTRLFTSALVLVAAAAGLAAAEPDGPGRHHGDKAARLAQFDTNVDTNGDGVLSPAEREQAKAAFKAKHAERHAAKLAQFNTNQDGTLAPAERQQMHEARAAERFAALDTNKDGALSLAEFKAGKGERHARGGHRANGRGRR